MLLFIENPSFFILICGHYIIWTMGKFLEKLYFFLFYMTSWMALACICRWLTWNLNWIRIVSSSYLRFFFRYIQTLHLSTLFFYLLKRFFSEFRNTMVNINYKITWVSKFLRINVLEKIKLKNHLCIKNKFILLNFWKLFNDKWNVWLIIIY